MEGTDQKRCRVCGLCQPLANFGPSKQSRDGRRSECYDCRRAEYWAKREENLARMRAYNAAHRDELNARKRAYHHMHRDECHARNKAWKQANRERHLEQRRRYWQENREHLVAEQRANPWYKRNPEKIKLYRKKQYESDKVRHYSYTKKWNSANPDKALARWHRRRALEVDADGHFTAAEWRELCAQYRNACLCCGAVAPLTADHVIPLSRGGSNAIANIQPLCKGCNSAKGTASTDYR